MSCHCIQHKKIAAPPKMAKATLPRRSQAAPPKEEGDFIVIKICNFNQFSLMCSNFVVSVSFLSDKKRKGQSFFVKMDLVIFNQGGICHIGVAEISLPAPGHLERWRWLVRREKTRIVTSHLFENVLILRPSTRAGGKCA